MNGYLLMTLIAWSVSAALWWANQRVVADSDQRAERLPAFPVRVSVLLIALIGVRALLEAFDLPVNTLLFTGSSIAAVLLVAAVRVVVRSPPFRGGGLNESFGNESFGKVPQGRVFGCRTHGSSCE